MGDRNCRRAIVAETIDTKRHIWISRTQCRSTARQTGNRDRRNSFEGKWGIKEILNHDGIRAGTDPATRLTKRSLDGHIQGLFVADTSWERREVHHSNKRTGWIPEFWHQLLIIH
jgi:hypothetical protein